MKTNLFVLVKVHGEQVKIFPHKTTCTALERHRTFTDEKRLEAKTSALICQTNGIKDFLNPKEHFI